VTPVQLPAKTASNPVPKASKVNAAKAKAASRAINKRHRMVNNPGKVRAVAASAAKARVRAKVPNRAINKQRKTARDRVAKDNAKVVVVNAVKVRVVKLATSKRPKTARVVRAEMVKADKVVAAKVARAALLKLPTKLVIKLRRMPLINPSTPVKPQAGVVAVVNAVGVAKAVAARLAIVAHPVRAAILIQTNSPPT
jgi:hypothetical protein